MHESTYLSTSLRITVIWF